jgi:hypothetical protein
VVYAQAEGRNVRLTAGEGHEVHGWLMKQLEPLEFDIPAASIVNGELTLVWTQEADKEAPGAVARSPRCGCCGSKRGVPALAARSVPSRRGRSQIWMDHRYGLQSDRPKCWGSPSARATAGLPSSEHALPTTSWK